MSSENLESIFCWRGLDWEQTAFLNTTSFTAQKIKFSNKDFFSKCK